MQHISYHTCPKCNKDNKDKIKELRELLETSYGVLSYKEFDNINKSLEVELAKRIMLDEKPIDESTGDSSILPPRIENQTLKLEMIPNIKNSLNIEYNLQCNKCHYTVQLRGIFDLPKQNNLK